MNKILVGTVLAALLGSSLNQTALADTAEATCEVRKGGERQNGKSGPCTFSQRQGYIDIGLKNGDTISLSPVGNGPDKYKDQNGNKVTRAATSSGMDFKWEGGKRLTVTWRSGGSNGYGAPATTPSGMSQQRQSADWQRGYQDGLAGRYDQYNHTQPYKDGVAAGEQEAARNGGGGGGNGNYFVNELDKGGFEVVWKGQSCFVSYDARGRSTSVSPGCNDKQIQRSNEYARNRTR